MPYIKQEGRDLIDPGLNQASGFIFEKGDLTYALYKLCVNYMKKRDVSYTNISTTMSCLEDAKLEWHRRQVAPYEDQKMIENGDIE